MYTNCFEQKNRMELFLVTIQTPLYHLHSWKLEFLAIKWAITEKLSDFLNYGSPFEVFINHNLLTYILTLAKLNPTVLKWIAGLGRL